MKKTLLTLIIFSLNLFLYCQDINQAIDSLNLIIKSPKTNDTTLIQTYNQLSEVYYQINPDTTKQICEENVSRIDYLLTNSRKGYTPNERKALLNEKIRAQNNIAVVLLKKETLV